MLTEAELLVQRYAQEYNGSEGRLRPVMKLNSVREL